MHQSVVYPGMRDLRVDRPLATEWKVVVPAALARDVAGWAAERLAADPHATTATGDGYRTTTVYFDTPGWDVFQRRGSYGRSKYRVRAYGARGPVFLERKMRTRDRLSKRRTAVEPAELSALMAASAFEARPGAWFIERLRLRALAPVLVLRYDRIARVGLGAAGPFRLTLDHGLRGLAADTITLDRPDHDLVRVLPDQAVLEMKFVREVPAVFKALIERFGIAPMPFSKYRHALPRLSPALEASCLAS